MSETTTYPGSVTVLSGETRPLGIDMGLLLKDGQSVGTPLTAHLYDITDGDPGTSFPSGLVSVPSVSGTVVSQTVTALVPLHTYRLVLGFQAAVGTIWQSGTTIVCPF